MGSVTRKRQVAVKRANNAPSGEQLFKRAFSHAAIGLALVDLDGNFVYTNPAYSTITGYSPQQLKRLTISTLMRPEDAKANAVLRAKMLAGKIPGYVIEKRYVRKDGSSVWVKSSISLITDRHDNPVHIVGLIEDIDEHHKAEKALKESEARFRFMAEYMPPKVFTAEPDGTIDYLSPQWVSYTGLSVEAMNLRDWSHVVHPDDLEDNFKLWQQAIRTGRPFYFEQRLRRADGTYRWHVNRAHAMRDPSGAIIKWIGSATDIEELRQSRDLKTRLRTAAKQRKQLIRMNQSKDEFIMLASHQLRTPASGVKQFLGMVLEGYGGKVPAKQRDMLRRAYECNERQLKIADDLLKVARIDAGQVSLSKTPCDLVQLIRDVVAEQHDTFANRKQKVVFNPGRRHLSAYMDAKLMYMVLENLLDNASKYSAEGQSAIVGLREHKGNIIISVKDSGVGIKQKDRHKLFQKFSRVNNPLSNLVGGTGLGLYLAKKIVELHGGSLEVTSKINQGSTFSIKLPTSPHATA